MIKKKTKYLKFVVCCALIMSLVAPSYAALSASDGSAFVTKAEFDSALADFNARLTTFEAGINSKIDSQVSSYLDRNGIWNGNNHLDTNSLQMVTYTQNELKVLFAGTPEKETVNNGDLPDIMAGFGNLNVPSFNFSTDILRMAFSGSRAGVDCDTHFTGLSTSLGSGYQKFDCVFNSDATYAGKAPELVSSGWNGHTIPVKKSGLMRCQFYTPPAHQYNDGKAGILTADYKGMGYLFRGNGVPWSFYAYGALINRINNTKYITFKFLNVMPAVYDSNRAEVIYTGLPKMNVVANPAAASNGHWFYWYYNATENATYTLQPDYGMLSVQFLAGETIDLYFFVNKGDELGLDYHVHWPAYFSSFLSTGYRNQLQQPYLTTCVVY